ncbi:V2 protein [Myrica rubra citlodavirus 1]|nr:V2 protein [Myrica rubra citlodavirus 1]
MSAFFSRCANFPPSLVGMLCMCGIRYLQEEEKKLLDTCPTEVKVPEWNPWEVKDWAVAVKGLHLRPEYEAQIEMIMKIRLTIRLFRRFGKKGGWIANGKYKEWKKLWESACIQGIANVGQEEKEVHEVSWSADWAEESVSAQED